MANDNLMDQLLYLYNNTTLFFNLSEQIVTHYYLGNQCILNNISFDEFINDFSHRNKFSDESEKKTKKILW